MKVLKRKKIESVHVFPGDIFQLEYEPEIGEKRILLKQNIVDPAIFDTAIIIELDHDDFGMESGLGGIVGKEK